MSHTRVNLAPATLFVGTFVLGTAELGVVGMLNLIAADMGVSISAAGTLVTACALGLHGLFVGVAFTVATSVVPAERAGRATSAVISGFAGSGV